MTDRFGSLVASIYDAVDDADAFARLTGLLARETGATHAWFPMFRTDGSLLAIPVHNFPIDEVIGPWGAYYLRIDPWKKAMDRLPIGRPWRLDPQVPVAAVLRSEIYNDLIKPTTGGLVHCMPTMVKLDDKMGSLSLLRTQRAGAFSDEDEALIARIAPHLRRMMQLRDRFEEAGHGARLAEDALDQLTFGVLRCQADGRIRFANVMARSILASRDGLRATPLLECALRGATAALHERLRAVVRGRVPEQALLVERPSGLAAYRIVVVPVGAPTHTNQALVVVHDPEQREASLGQRAAALFGLSAAEADLTVGLIDGETLQEIADRRSVRISTVRSQFQSVLAKTGTRRQSDLIRAVLALGATRGVL
jgi:DNA-binding CsgD family transcriptional regulator/PAS domain-containing protein